VSQVSVRRPVWVQTTKVSSQNRKPPKPQTNKKATPYHTFYNTLHHTKMTATRPELVMTKGSATPLSSSQDDGAGSRFLKTNTNTNTNTNDDQKKKQIALREKKITADTTDTTDTTPTTTFGTRSTNDHNKNEPDEDDSITSSTENTMDSFLMDSFNSSFGNVHDNDDHEDAATSTASPLTGDDSSIDSNNYFILDDDFLQDYDVPLNDTEEDAYKGDGAALLVLLATRQEKRRHGSSICSGQQEQSSFQERLKRWNAEQRELNFVLDGDFRRDYDIPLNDTEEDARAALLVLLATRQEKRRHGSSICSGQQEQSSFQERLKNWNTKDRERELNLRERRSTTSTTPNKARETKTRQQHM
jgi:hypothetical protein